MKEVQIHIMIFVFLTGGPGIRIRQSIRLIASCTAHLYCLPAFAQVRLAMHIPTGQKVAIKLFDKTKKLSDYEMKNFYREATVLRRVQTQHACAAFQFLDAE